MNRDVIRTVAIVIAERNPGTDALVGDDPEYYMEKTSIAAKLNMRLQDVKVARSLRTSFLGWLFEIRNCKTSKQISLAQAQSIRSVDPDTLVGAYNEYLKQLV